MDKETQTNIEIYMYKNSLDKNNIVPYTLILE